MSVEVGDKFKATYADGMYEWTVREVEGKFVLADTFDEHGYGELEQAFLVGDVERRVSFYSAGTW